jgi:MarR-like DNA-binding transcriptional regulator SgrR of sgrS sRNA
MNPREYYHRLSYSIKDAELRLVADIMSDYIGEENAVKLPVLCKRVSMSERKVRMILERLTKEFGIPIGAQSGKAGRFIIATEDERQAVIADLASRVSETQARIQSLRNAKLVKVAPIEPQYETPSLFGEPEVHGYRNPLEGW